VPRIEKCGHFLERWKPIPGFPDYMAGNKGCIKSLKRGGRILQPGVKKSGGGKHGTSYTYLHVALMQNGKRVTCPVHQLVLAAFVGPRPEGMETRHLNGDSKDNRLKNLKYGTKSENAYDTVRHGRHNMQKRF
jgi:hypothetical protein